jgi:hypothetical protein
MARIDIEDVVNGLRRLADFVDENRNIFHEDLCDFSRSGLELSTCLFDNNNDAQDQLTVLRDAANKLVADAPYHVTSTEEDTQHFREIQIDFGGGIKLELSVNMDQVCEKVVVGHKSEYVEEAVAWERKLVEVPIEEWRCI